MQDRWAAVFGKHILRMMAKNPTNLGDSFCCMGIAKHVDANNNLQTGFIVRPMFEDVTMVRVTDVDSLLLQIHPLVTHRVTGRTWCSPSPETLPMLHSWIPFGSESWRLYLNSI